jgi:D-alanyl-D-alanine dipeptidase
MKPAGLRPIQGLLSVYQNLHQQKIPFPATEAYLHKEAIQALCEANVQILDAGGRLFLSSVWRRPEDQFKSWLDWKLGRKVTYSPPPGESMHECGRAIDIDTRPSQLKIEHSAVRDILIRNLWFPVAPLGMPGDNHYEHRDPILQREKSLRGHASMVKMAFSEIRYVSIPYAGVDAEDTDPRLPWL